MSRSPKRAFTTVDLTPYPGMVVVYLGMRVTAWRGIRTVSGIGQQIGAIVSRKPDGLLRHETFLFSLREVGLRQYWRDFDALERWTRSDQHREWWIRFSRDRAGTEFWHEAYCIGGGMEGLYSSPDLTTGFRSFLPGEPATGRNRAARHRAGVSGDETIAMPPEEA